MCVEESARGRSPGSQGKRCSRRRWRGCQNRICREIQEGNYQGSSESNREPATKVKTRVMCSQTMYQEVQESIYYFPGNKQEKDRSKGGEKSYSEE